MAKTFISLAARNALVYFFLFIIGLTLSSVLFLSYSSIEIHDLTDKRLKHTQEMIQLRFETYLGQLEDDINQLSYSPLLEAYLLENDSADLSILFKEYSSFLKSKDNYFQIRLLSTDAKGKEILRVEKVGETISRCPESELQFKGNRDYFRELIQLSPGVMYYSKIDLNKENGKISDPRTPTLRTGKVIKGLSGGECILIANVNLTQVFYSLEALVPDHHELRLFNQEGHYLIHPDTKQTFTFETNTGAFFSNEYNLRINEITYDGMGYSNENSVSNFFNLKYDRPEYSLYGGVSVDNEIVFASFYSWRKKMILISLIVALSFLIVAFVYMRKQTKELRSITEELKLFSSQIKPKRNITQRNDEIGELAKSFEEMSQKVYESHSEMEKARSIAEKAHQEKEEFLENMSHEIRNPLQSILGGIHILEQNQQSDYQRPFIESLKFNSQQLNSLVTDVLDFGKLKSGQIRLNEEWYDLKQFCEDLVHASRYSANKKNISVEIDYASTLDAFIFKFDRIRLYQIINNLLSNAVKFTPDYGKIQFKIEFLQNKKIHFLIIDNGIGIVEGEKEVLLQRKMTTNYNSGTGLGLAIVQELLSIHGTSLEADSQPGIGSRFGFSLALERKLRTAGNTQIDILNYSQKRETTILILEDDKELQEWYTYILKDFDISILPSLDELDKLEPENFDFIICDLNLGETRLSDGNIDQKILPLLKKLGKLLIVSGSAVMQLHPGVVFLKKPIDKEELMVVLVNHQLAVLHGTPDFSGIEKDYDQNKALVHNALNILIKAWEEDKTGLISAINNENQVEFQKIKHRIITTIRRLNLPSFEVFLNDLDIFASNKGNNLKLVNEKLSFYISKMKVYRDELK